MKNYKLLIFDLDNTIIDYDKAELESLKYIYNKFFCKNTSFEVMINEFKVINLNLWVKYQNSDISIEELRIQRFRQLADLFKIQFSIFEIKHEYETQVGQRVYLFDGALSFLQYVKMSYKLCIVSNGISSIQYKKINSFGLNKIFNKIYISEDVGFQKPNPKIFEIALLEFSIKPENTLMIGDSLSSDLLGAKNANIDFCWFNINKYNFDYEYPSPNFIVESYIELKQLLHV